MTILVVRHGETDGNAARILQRPDVPLNQRGMRLKRNSSRSACSLTVCPHRAVIFARAYDGGAARCLFGDYD